MDRASQFAPAGHGERRVLLKDSERAVCREWRRCADGTRRAVLTVLPTAERFSPAAFARLVHEYELKDQLDSAWAARPLELESEPGRTMLVLSDPGGEPLMRLLGTPMEAGRFLRLAIGITTALAALHERGLVHKDIKPAHILVDEASGQAWFTGFGIASRLPTQRQVPVPPETISGTLAYMAPEQTGRMNRSIDARSDLYTLGVTLYEMVTGGLPFLADNPIEWVHCHIARRPVSPSDRLDGVAPPVSGIIMKLLAKTAEERYQTAAGVQRDLRHCLADWEAHGRIDEFPLGRDDTPDRLWIPEKLYGRTREVEALIAAFDRVAGNGASEVVLVSGYAGIGKSSVVNELHRVLVPRHGIFASGKCDQFKRDIPYSALIQALRSLVRPLLGMNEDELANWRKALAEALGPNARLITDLVPELSLVLGEQPAVSELAAQDAQRRFHLVFRGFIGVFARPEHPLALFLDDLQWLDAAAFGLLADLLRQANVRHLLLIGAYRDNELEAVHPLRRTLDAVRHGPVTTERITLTPLTQEHLAQLIADALRCEPRHAAPLARLVHDRTAGNPFFARRFLYTLAEERLLAFDHGTARWTWDLEQIRAKGYTDNVVQLMVGKLTRLPRETRKALQLMACLGTVAEITMLSSLLGTGATQVEAALFEALREDLIVHRDRSYRFVHDRVQEAAYSLIPVTSREAEHLRIGRLLAARTPPEQREEAIFEIVNHLNHAANLITSRQEREQLASFNLIAGRRASSSTAYTSALVYLAAGATLLPEDAWDHRHDLIFALELDRARCEFLTGEPGAAERRLAALSTHAANTGELASVACLRMDLYTVLGQHAQAVAVCLGYLQRLGIDWSADPTTDSARRAYERVRSMLGDRAIGDLVQLPAMTDPVSLATLEVLTNVLSPAMSTSENLVCLAVCEAVGLSLERGNSDGSCVAYVTLGMITGLRFGDYDAGYRFGRLAYELVESHGSSRFKARTYVSLAHNIVPWTKSIRASRDLLRRGFDSANAIGDVMFAAYSRMHLNANLLAAGEPLEAVQRRAERGLGFSRAAQFDLVMDIIHSQLRFIRTLRGLTPKFGCLNDDTFDESQFESRLASDATLALRACKYWILVLQARYLAGDYVAALAALSSAEPLLWLCPAYFETTEFHFYGALCRAASWRSGSPDRTTHLAALTNHHGQLETWAATCPENFESRATLVSAEIARIQGRDMEAMTLYDDAIRSSHANGFTHHEALANELAARFYTMRGFDKIALTYLRDARDLYFRWGADGKARHLEQLHPQLSQSEPTTRPTHTIGERVEQLDLATVLKVSQAISGAIVLGNLLDTLMRTAIEQAGAERGLLVLPNGGAQEIAAEATTSGDAIVVNLGDQPVTSTLLPESVVHTVLRTRETIILDDAAAEPAFSGDAYIRHRNTRSILCLPLINQSKLIGALYLENNLAPRVFTPARIAVLRLLALQAAIALENTRLYHDLAEREAKIRRLVDANIIGIFMWDAEGHILEANDAFLRIVGYDRAELLAGQLRWRDLMTADWLEHDQRRQVPAMKVTGSLPPCEAEYFRKDGSRVPVLVGATSFNEAGSQGVSFVLDLTERKQGEQALRQAEAGLTHLTRVMTMGELTASIAHEINQPLAALAITASACWRWLSRQPPDLNKALASLQRMVQDAERAGAVITRVRSLVTKSAPAKISLDLNDAIREVLALVEPEARRHGVLVRTELAGALSPVTGDRVQLQQVILNLAVNGIEAMKDIAGRPRELSIRSGTNEVGMVLVSVRDTGVGLAGANPERVFEAFYTTKNEGMGMGLSISRSIIAAHGGLLWPATDDGHGATFHFTLPADDMHDDSPAGIRTTTAATV